MKYLKWCISKEYRPVEVIFLVAAAILLNQGHLALFIIMIVLYLIMDTTLQLISKKVKDKPWKKLADRDHKVEAIKTYRQIYGASLREAHDVVMQYVTNKTR